MRGKADEVAWRKTITRSKARESMLQRQARITPRAEQITVLHRLHGSACDTGNDPEETKQKFGNAK